MKANLHLSKWQHIYPKALIKNFADENNEVTICNLNNKKVRKQKFNARGEDFCVNRLWGEKAEKGWMKAIEDSFLEICDMIDNNSFNNCELYNQRITDFYIMWYLRSYVEKNPCEKLKIISEEFINEHRKGQYPTALIVAGITSNMELIPFPSKLNDFPIDKRNLCDINTSTHLKTGNQFKDAKILMGTPRDDDHKKRLESNIPWDSSKSNKSKHSIGKWNERESVYYVDEYGYISSRFLNDFKIRKSLVFYSKMLSKLSWGVLTTDCGEFIVPRGLNMTCVIPLSPKIAFMANLKDTNITCQDVKNVNTSMLEGQSQYFCSDVDSTMLFKDTCPIAK